MSGIKNPQDFGPEHYQEGELKGLEDQIYGEPSVEQKCTEISSGFLYGEYFHSTLAETRTNAQMLYVSKPGFSSYHLVFVTQGQFSFVNSKALLEKERTLFLFSLIFFSSDLHADTGIRWSAAN